MELSKLRKALKNPREFPMELNCRYHWWKEGAQYNTDGIDIFAQEWDYLVILDALRQDDFRELNELPGEVTTKESRGAATIEFLNGNFKDRTFDDTVYVTGNPQLDANSDHLNVSFHHVENVWKHEWDDDRSTVMPETMAKATIEAAEEYPNKRILSHFIQPHAPYIGPTADEHDLGGHLDPDPDIGLRDILSGARYQLFRDDSEIHRTAYRENIELTMPHVANLFEALDGKFVVTSDHGSMFGERATPIPVKYFSHRHGCHVDTLLTVPWLEYTTGPRRDIVSGQADTNAGSTSADVQDRLEDLGYM